MSQRNTTGTKGAAFIEDLAVQEDMEAKNEMARRLLEGVGVDKDEAKAVSLLKDCVAHGDADATMMLAKCCALGVGMEHNTKRAEALVSDAAKKGSDEARILLQLINEWKGKKNLDLRGLWNCACNEPSKKLIFVVSTERGKEECTIECVALVISIVPCRELNLNSLP